jgi:hypothetical protein
VIDFDNPARPKVYSGIPQQNLWQDALDYFEKSSEDLEALALKLNKYVLPIRENFCDKVLPIRRIYILEPKDGALGIETLRGLEGLQGLGAQVFREQFLNPITGSANLMKQLALLANAVVIRRISRPKALDSHEALVRLIEEDLGKEG